MAKATIQLIINSAISDDDQPSGYMQQISTSTSADPERDETRAALVVEDRGIAPMAQKGPQTPVQATGSELDCSF